MKKVLFLTAIAALFMTSCSNMDVYDEKAVEELKGVANDFDFSTKQSVNLSVDYTAYETYGPVFFSVYAENPFTGSEESLQLKADATPIFSAYTNADRRYNETITLPAYAKKLYVVTGNFLIAQSLIETEINNGRATAKAINYATASAAARGTRSMTRAAEFTRSLETLYQLYYKVDVNTGDKGEDQILNEWATPLGTWEKGSGRPSYLLDPATADPKLVLTQSEQQDLYQAVSDAIGSHQSCNILYRKQDDLTLAKESEVSITFLGSSTCWNNSLGYYYYTENQRPTSLEDLHVIMLFPNTQDGCWSRTWCQNPNFYGNIALERGDAVQLMYYPNIANGDTSNGTTKFPEGTKIGFILKTNGWGMQKAVGDKKYYNSYKGEGAAKTSKIIGRQYNIWGCSTDGLSYYCDEYTTGDQGAFTAPNAERESRVAKFAYTDEDGNDYAIVSFEDACNDTDFDDLIFALKPVNAFSELPKIESKKSTDTSVYAFEDLYPSKGDYDMNDIVVELQDTKTFTKKSTETEYKVTTQTFALTTYQNYVTKTSGLALALNTPNQPASIAMKKVVAGTNDTIDVTYNVETFDKYDDVYLLTNDVKGEIKSTYILELTYTSGIKETAKLASVKPFVFREDAESDLRWEVHIPYEAPTPKFDTQKYFRQDDDLSVPAEGKYFVRRGDYPFAFCLTGVSVDKFFGTILNRTNERKPIDQLYQEGEFIGWSTSKGTLFKDWYLRPATKN